MRRVCSGIRRAPVGPGPHQRVLQHRQLVRLVAGIVQHPLHQAGRDRDAARAAPRSLPCAAAASCAGSGTGNRSAFRAGRGTPRSRRDSPTASSGRCRPGGCWRLASSSSCTNSAAVGGRRRRDVAPRRRSPVRGPCSGTAPRTDRRRPAGSRRPAAAGRLAISAVAALRQPRRRRGRPCSRSAARRSNGAPAGSRDHHAPPPARLRARRRARAPESGRRAPATTCRCRTRPSPRGIGCARAGDQLGHLLVAAEEQVRFRDLERAQPGVGILERLQALRRRRRSSRPVSRGAAAAE